MANSSTAGLTPATPPQPAFRRIIIVDMALPFLTILVLSNHNVAPLRAYAAAAAFPAASVVVSWFGQRRFDVVGLGVLFGIASSLALALLTGDPRLGLVRAAPAFALFGIACLASLPTARPLMFYVARAFATGGDASGKANWNQRLANAGFLRGMRKLTAVWGIGTLAHAVLGVAVVFLLPATVAVIVEPAIAVTILAALLAWTAAVQRRARAGGA